MIYDGAWFGCGASYTLPSQQWIHLTGTYDGQNLITYLNGSEIKNCDIGVRSIDINTNDLHIGANSTIHEFDGRIDETSIWSRALDADEVRELYQRGANRVKFQVRSCDDNACDTETWIGPDGTNQTYYSELDNCDSIDANGVCDGDVQKTLPYLVFGDFDGAQAVDNQYFQYKVILESDAETACAGNPCFPEVTSVSLMPRAGSTVSGAEIEKYWGGVTTVVNSSAQSFSDLTSMSVTEGGDCTVYHQVSTDSGSNYQYYNGSSWASATNETTTRSTKTQIEAGISSLPVGSGSFKFKTIFHSYTDDSCSISNIDLVGEE